MKQFWIIFSSLYLSSCSWFRPTYTSGLEGQILPNFNLTLKDSTTSFNTSQIPSGHPFALFLFQPYCPYCRGQLDDIIKNIADFNDTRLYLITPASYQSIDNFCQQFNLQQYPEITMLRDSSDKILTYFNAPGVPYTAFYDKDKRLKSVIIGKNNFTLIRDKLSN
jgi:peroxiredoxin